MKIMIIVGHYLLNLLNLLLLLLLIIRMDKFPTSIVSPKAHKNYPQLSCQETWVRVWVWGCYFLKKGTWVCRGYCFIYIYGYGNATFWKRVLWYVKVAVYIYIYIYICVCVCACVRACVRACVCVCVCVIVTSYMHVDFFINYESWFIIINSMIIWTMNI